MPRGRKVKADAQRRGGHKPSPEVISLQALEAKPVESLSMPQHIADNEIAAECWGWIVSGGQKYEIEDIPLISELAEWWAISRQCSANIMNYDGSIITVVDTPTGEKANPDIRTKALASSHIRYLSGELGIGPSTRMRLGLMDAASKSITLDISERIHKALEANKAFDK